jgi:hypothetical protein
MSDATDATIDFYLKQGDTLGSLVCILSDANGVVNLTTATSVQFHMQHLMDPSVPEINASASVVSAVAGSVRYDWATHDLDFSGDYAAEFQVAFSGSGIGTFPNYRNINIRVTPQLA